MSGFCLQYFFFYFTRIIHIVCVCVCVLMGIKTVRLFAISFETFEILERNFHLVRDEIVLAFLLLL